MATHMQRDIIQQQLDLIDQQPEEAVAARLAELDQVIDTLPVRQAQPGHITMREHLTQVRQQVVADPQTWLTHRRAELVSLLESLPDQEPS